MVCRVSYDTSAPSHDVSWLCNAQAVKENESEALEEARLAVEEIVLTRQQAIELLPRTPSVIEQQVRPYNVLRGAACSGRRQFIVSCTAS